MADAAPPPPPPPAEAAPQPPPAPAHSLAAPPDPPTPSTVRLAVIGDVHGAWGPEDEAALVALAPTAALFVGDFGEEDVALVRAVASGSGGGGGEGSPPTAAAGAGRAAAAAAAATPTPAPATSPPRFFVLGNHDAWFCLTAKGRDRAARRGGGAAAAASVSPGVEAQVAALGRAHVGWGHRLAAPPPAPPLAVAGARPFSKGGARWSDVADFYAAYDGGVASMEEAGHRTAAALRAAAADLAAAAAAASATPAGLVLLAHNGPAGLGSQASDPCGADFLPGGGDWGDPDTAAALADVAARGPPAAVPAAVLFGHMHRNLRGDPRPRDAVRFDGRTGTVYLNAAVTPRRRVLGPGVVGGGGGGGGGAAAPPTTACHFMVVEVGGGAVSAAADVWVGATPLPDGGFATAPLLERPLLVREEGGRRRRWAWQAHAGEWVAEHCE